MLAARVLLCCVTAMAACSSATRLGDVDASTDADPLDASDVDEPRPPPDSDVCPNLAPQCGDGVLDEGEECDDRNRLNGDGCDWLCRLGDGDPAPPPDPTVTTYEPVGECLAMDDLVPRWSFSVPELPVVWTGSELAVSIGEVNTDAADALRFRRLDPEARTIGTDWVSPPLAAEVMYSDVAWTGEEFGLVYNGRSTGIFFVRLDRGGSPLGDPFLIISDPTAYSPSIDVTDDGFVLVWRQGLNPGSVACTGADDQQTVFLRLLNRDGTTTGRPDPVVIACDASGPPTVVAGVEGFGVTSFIAGMYCAQRFVWVSRDLTQLVYSGVLSNGEGSDVAYAGGRYYVAWPHWEDAIEDFQGELCVARFTETGALEQAPVCNVGGGPRFEPVYLAVGDGGLGMVAGSESALYFVRTDLNGTEIASPMLVPFAQYGPNGPNGITWMDGSFAVLFSTILGERPLRLQLFGPSR